MISDHEKLLKKYNSRKEYYKANPKQSNNDYLLQGVGYCLVGIIGCLLYYYLSW